MNKCLNDFKAGSVQAFEEIYREYLQRVIYFARQYLPDEESAKSTAHDVFLSLWENHQAIDVSQNFSAYIFTITKNKCLNRLKHLQIQQKYAQGQGLAMLKLHEEALSDKTSDLLLANEFNLAFGSALKNLSPKIKEAFILSRFKQLSYKDIAIRQTVSVKTVEYRIMQALKHIRKEMKDFLEKS